MIARRRLLQAAVLSPGAALLPSAAHAGAESDPEGTVVDLGPACVSAPLGNAEFVGDVLYAGTRGLSPNAVGAYDLATDRVTTHFDVPTGIGVWAMCRLDTDVYIGTHAASDLYRLDTTTGTMTKVGDYPYNVMWSLASSPDGKVFAAFSDPSHVVEYDPATGESRDLGAVVEGEAYARSIVADETTIYAGIGAHAHLIAIDRATGGKRDILPESLLSRDFVASLTQSETHLAGGISSNGEVLVMSKADPADHRVLTTDEKYIPSVLLHDGHVYFTGRPTGTLYRCAVDGGEIEVLGVAQPEAPTHRLLAHDGRVWGVQDGAAFVFDPADESLRFISLVQRGFKTAPEEPMSVHSSGSLVYVGGKGGVDIHDPAAGERVRLGIPGEPKTALTVSDTTYLGVYTQALLYSHQTGDTEATLLAKTGNRQDRPRELAYDKATGLIAMTTQPEPGQTNGTLALYAPRTGEFEVHRPVVERQSLYAVTCRAGVAYLGTNIQEGLGLPPVTETARLAAFDLRTRELRWQLEPVPGAKYIPGLTHTKRMLYGMTGNGVLFEYDLVRDEPGRTVQVGSRGSDIHVIGRVAYTTDGQAIYRIDLDDLTITTIVTGLAGEWFGNDPKLALDPSKRALFGLRKRNLVRVSISPR